MWLSYSWSMLPYVFPDVCRMSVHYISYFLMIFLALASLASYMQVRYWFIYHCACLVEPCIWTGNGRLHGWPEFFLSTQILLSLVVHITVFGWIHFMWIATVYCFSSVAIINICLSFSLPCSVCPISMFSATTAVATEFYVLLTLQKLESWQCLK